MQPCGVDRSGCPSSRNDPSLSTDPTRARSSPTHHGLACADDDRRVHAKVDGRRPRAQGAANEDGISRKKLRGMRSRRVRSPGAANTTTAHAPASRNGGLEEPFNACSLLRLHHDTGAIAGIAISASQQACWHHGEYSSDRGRRHSRFGEKRRGGLRCTAIALGAPEGSVPASARAS